MEAAVPDQPGLRRRQLTETLLGEYGHLGVTGLLDIGEGMDAKVYRAHSRELGPVAIKMPHSRWISSGNEPMLDTRVVLRKEFLLCRYLHSRGLQVPEPFLLHTADDGVDFVVSRFVESDGSGLPDADFGHLIRVIHDIPAPPADLIAGEPAADTDEVLAERVGRRLKALVSVADLNTGTPDIRQALAAGPRYDAPGCLLHMDLRPENILARRGRPAAVLDWSNALTGDTALDLSRAAEYGTLTAAALEAYGNRGAFSLTPTNPRAIIYRLDTAIMLAHVFLTGAPDPARARHYLHRTETLCRALREINR
jgi:aminoglycoside phosphotransferase (APT) family kinase protein